MKSTIFFVLLGLLSANAQAAHFECTGAHNLEKVSFDLTASVENFKVVAPVLEQKGLNDSFVQVNEFTLVAYQLLDNLAQETIDYTLIIDRDAKTVQVLSQWSTNENVDSEKLACTVTE